MKQTDLGLDLSNRRTRKVFLDEMERVVPWQALLTLIATHPPVKASCMSASALGQAARAGGQSPLHAEHGGAFEPGTETFVLHRRYGDDSIGRNAF